MKTVGLELEARKWSTSLLLFQLVLRQQLFLLPLNVKTELLRTHFMKINIYFFFFLHKLYTLHRNKIWLQPDFLGLGMFTQTNSQLTFLQVSVSDLCRWSDVGLNRSWAFPERCVGSSGPLWPGLERFESCSAGPEPPRCRWTDRSGLQRDAWC